MISKLRAFYHHIRKYVWERKYRSDAAAGAAERKAAETKAAASAADNTAPAMNHAPGAATDTAPAADHPTKVIVVSHSAVRSGAPMLALHIIRELKSRGIETAAFLMEPGDMTHEFFAECPTYWGFGKQRMMASFRELKSRGFSICICNSAMSGNAAAAAHACGMRVVSLVHEMPNVLGLMDGKIKSNKIYQYSDRIIFPSSVVEERFVEFIGKESAGRDAQGMTSSQPSAGSDVSAISDDAASGVAVRDARCVIRPQGIYNKPDEAVLKLSKAEARKIVAEKFGIGLSENSDNQGNMIGSATGSATGSTTGSATGNTTGSATGNTTDRAIGNTTGVSESGRARRLVINISTVSERKGFDIFLRLSRLCPDTEFFWVAAEHNIFYQSAMNENKPGSNFHETGFIHDTDLLYTIYRAADIFALTSREEPMASTVMEALSAGVPVLAFAGCGGHVDVIKDGVNGYLAGGTAALTSEPTTATDAAAARTSEPAAATDATAARTSERAAATAAGNCVTAEAMKEKLDEFFALDSAAREQMSEACRCAAADMSFEKYVEFVVTA